MGVNIESLPDEILSMVFKHFIGPDYLPWPLGMSLDNEGTAKSQVHDKRNKRTLFHASLVSKSWRSLAEPMLYYSIYMFYDRDDETLQLPLINSHPSPSRHVQQLDITVPAESIIYSLAARCHSVRHVLLWIDTFNADEVKPMVDMLSTMPRLQSLVLAFDEDGMSGWEDLDRSARMDQLFRAMGATLGASSATPSSSLQTLEVRHAPLFTCMDTFTAFLQTTPIQNLALWACEVPESHTYLFQIAKVGLTCLSLDTMSNPQTESIGGLRSLSSLRHLRLGNGVGDSAGWLKLELPVNLTTLTLLDPASAFLVDLIEGLGSPALLPKLEVLRLDFSIEDDFNMFVDTDEGAAISVRGFRRYMKRLAKA